MTPGGWRRSRFARVPRFDCRTTPANLLHRMSRGPASLFVADTLDRAARWPKRLTIPFVRSVLG